MRCWSTNPLHPVKLVRGSGCRVWDARGRSYLDLLAGTWCNVLGHSHPRWVRAVTEQAATLAHVGAAFGSEEVEVGLAKLAEILPPALDRAVLLSSGSEAVELALKIARAATGADGVVVVERGYYGATAYALALSEAGRTLRCLPAIDGVHRLPLPHCARCPAGRAWPCGDLPCLAPLERLAAEGRGRIAAVLYEPVLGGGVYAPPVGWGARLRELATRCGALLVAEEVTTGVGRTGRWFGFEHDAIVPDVVVVGKAIGGGLPVSAVVASAEVEARAREALGRHVQSHQNDPFCGRLAATVVSIVQDEGLVERGAARGAQLAAGLERLRGSLPVREVRGRGPMIGVELEPEVAARGPELAARLLEAGFIVDFHAASSSFRLLPPLVISAEEVDAFLGAFRDVLAA